MSDKTKQDDVILRVAKQQRGSEEKAIETIQIVTFEIDKEEYAAPILDLKEILKTPDIIPVPGVHPFIKGIFNLRGQVVIVVDLEKRFSLIRENPTESRHAIIIELENTTFAIIVDDVTGVMKVPITSIKPTPSIISSKIHVDYLNGVIMLEKATTEEGKKQQARLILLLDLPKMLSEEELLNFGNNVQKIIS